MNDNKKKSNSLRILCYGYREWSLNIYYKLSKDRLLANHEFIQIQNSSLVNIEFINNINPSIILFFGWSKLIPEEITNSYCSLMLHPSPLPMFRGGSPIQNQIINGILDSEVCIFRMNNEIDTGDILGRSYLDLRGKIPEIFNRISNIGFKLTKDIKI